MRLFSHTFLALSTVANIRDIAAFLAVLLHVPAFAATVVIVAPNDLAATEGNSDNCFPFTCGNMRYQQVYDAAHFGGVTGVIDELLFRVAGGGGDLSDTYDLEIRLSHTTTTPSTLSTTFASNIGGDETLVLDSSSFSVTGTGGASVNPFERLLVGPDRDATGHRLDSQPP